MERARGKHGLQGTTGEGARGLGTPEAMSLLFFLNDRTRLAHNED